MDVYGRERQRHYLETLPAGEEELAADGWSVCGVAGDDYTHDLTE